MAIPSFVKFLKTNIHFLYKTLQALNLEVDNIYLDFNYVIGKVMEKHPIAGAYPTQEETLLILEETKKVLEECVKLYNPTNSIFVAFDGPQVTAKENHMRQMSNLTQIDQKFDNDHKKAIAKKWKEEGKQFDEELNAFIKKDFNKVDFFQCGSTFMHTISEGIREFIEKKVENEWKFLKFIISDDKVPGEVEYKIFDFIRSQISSKNYKQSANHFVISSDTDLIMGAIPLYKANIYISQNPLDINNIICIQEIQKFIETKMLDDEVDKEFIEENKIKERLYHDFALIFIFIGNDFLPALPSLENKLRAMYYLLEEYKKFLKKNRFFPIVDEDFYICLPKLQRFFYDLSQDQQNNLITERKKMNETLSKEQVQLKEKVEKNQELIKNGEAAKLTPLEQFNIDLDQLYLEKPKKPFTNEKGFFLQSQDNYTMEFYKEKFVKDKVDEQFVNDLCLNYIEGVIWNYEYLVRGVISWQWTFKYLYSPFPSDILNSFINFQKPNYPLKGGQYSALVCLVANASPVGDLSYLSESLQKLIKSSEISKFFPTDFEIDNHGKYYFKQSVLTNLPIVSLEEIKKAIKKIEKDLSAVEKEVNSLSKNPRVIMGKCPEIEGKDEIFEESDYQAIKIVGIFQRLQEAKGVFTFKLKYSDLTCEKLLKKMQESEKKQLEQEEKEKELKQQYLKQKQEEMSRLQCKYGAHCINLPQGKCKFYHSEEEVKNSNDKDYKPPQKKLPCTKGENCPFLKKGTCKFYHP